MRNINKIIVHCSATSSDMDIGAAEIHRWHLAKGWQGIGYNGVIRRNGSFEVGRDVDNDGDFDEEVGAHAYGFNTESIGLCMTGGINEQGEAENNFLDVQFNMLELILRGYLSKYPRIQRVLGHRDLPKVTKNCPCFSVTRFMIDRKIPDPIHGPWKRWIG